MLSRKFVLLQVIKRCPALGLVTKSTDLSSFTLCFCVILYRGSEIRDKPKLAVV